MKAVLALSIVFGVASATTAMAQLPGSFTRAADMATARSGHTATLLANGKVLIAGGSPLATAELYNPADGTFSPTGDMSVARAGHVAALLPNGQVLIAGGGTAELYDPVTGKFSPTDNMTSAGAGHSTVLQDGRVFIAHDGTAAEIYDPATGTFTATNPYATPGGIQWVFTDVLLQDGRVLVVGYNYNLGSANELYDPIAGTFSITGASLASGVVVATVLTSGQVLLVEANCDVDPDAVEVYDPASGKFTDIGSTRDKHPFSAGVLLQDGTFLVTGGQLVGGSPSTSAELYVPASGVFLSGNMMTAREYHTATLLPDGSVFIAGGVSVFRPYYVTASTEIYKPSSGVAINASPTSISPGSLLTATWSGIPSPTATDWVGLYVPGAADTAFLTYAYTTGSANGTVPLPIPANLASGSYELRLFSQNTFTRMAVSNSFTITPGLNASPTSISPGSLLTAPWSGIPSPTATDWVGLYVPGAADTAFLTYVYTTGSANGAVPLPIPANLAAGSYQLRLFSQNGYTRLAVSNSFTVSPQ
jgi:hypothetical protein